MDYVESAYKALKDVHFPDRFYTLVNSYTNFQNRLIKTQKKEVISGIKSIGYDFIYLDNAFHFEKDIHDFKFQVIFNIKNGTVLASLYVYHSGNLLDLIPGHFAFLRNHLEKKTDFIAPFYSSYEELFQIVKVLMNIVEDFIEKFVLVLDTKAGFID